MQMDSSSQRKRGGHDLKPYINTLIVCFTCIACVVIFSVTFYSAVFKLGQFVALIK